MNQEKIGNFIAAMRKEKGLTQAQLAEKLGVNNKTVSRWETGKNMPDYAILEDLTYELGITVNELIHCLAFLNASCNVRFTIHGQRIRANRNKR